jgi:hypothetical protein
MNAVRASALSPAASFSRLLLTQDEEPQIPLLDVTDTNDQNPTNRAVKKVKKTRLLLDARTELTDDELKVDYGVAVYDSKVDFDHLLGGTRTVLTKPGRIETRT